MNPISSDELAARLDASFWKPAASLREFAAFCSQAREGKYRAVCVNGSRVALAAAGLEDSAVQVVALIGFPLGTGERDVKRYETEAAVDSGAQEIELALNLGDLKNGNHKAVLGEIRDVIEAADERHVCVVLETRVLTRAEITSACALISDSGARIVSTGTDFWPDARVTADDVKALHEALGPKIIVKAAGNLRDPRSIEALIDAGAGRIGSHTPSILFKG